MAGLEAMESIHKERTIGSATWPHNDSRITTGRDGRVRFTAWLCRPVQRLTNNRKKSENNSFKPNRLWYCLDMKTNTNEIKAKYEILDSMEVLVATADSFDDAMFAAEKYAPAMVVKVATGKAVWTA